MGLLARVRSLLAGIRRGERLHDEMDAEFAHHMELRARDLMATGMNAEDARRAARLEFGPAESHKDEARRARGLARFDEMRVSLLDLRLGARMLLKYPGLTIVGGVAIAFAIGVGAGAFEFVRQVVHGTLPVPEGDRIVALRIWDAGAGDQVRPTVHDLELFRRELKTLQDIGAWTAPERNFSVGREAGAPLRVAEISVSAFRVTRVPALMGRTLQDADAEPGAPDVAVISHDVWQSRLGGAADVIGRQVRIGTTPVTIVGVMPKGYAFPVNHGVWRPLRLRDPGLGREGSPYVAVIYGRLADGRSAGDARREIEALVAREVAAAPEAERRRAGQVVPFTRAVLGFDSIEIAAIWSTNLLLIAVLVLICGNVSLLMFARAATRQTEIVVRSALGASRRRIVMQLFAEALVLAAVAAVAGLLVVDGALRYAGSVLEGQAGTLPFWMSTSLSSVTIGYATLLTVLAAVIAGVVPGLKITAGGLESRLRANASTGGSVKFGGLWTAVIVTQVAVTVLLPVITFGVRRDVVRMRDMPHGFAADRVLTAFLSVDPVAAREAGRDTATAVLQQSLAAHYATLTDRLLGEPGVTGVTYGDRLPLTYHPHRIMDLDAGPAAPLNPEWPDGYRVSNATVDPRFFEVLDVPVLSGRNFTMADADTTQRFVLVNQSFVKRVMGGHNPIGRRIRYTYFEGERKTPDREPGPWYQIVGVVKDLGMWGDEYDPKVARIYHAGLPATTVPLRLAVEVTGDPAAFSPRLREMVAEIDPTLRLVRPEPLPQVLQGEVDFNQFWFRMTAAITLITIGLSLAGIYAVMSFAVARRTREIGVRVALGAGPRRIVTAVFRQPITQVSIGILAGASLTAGLMAAASEGKLLVQGIAAAGISAAVIALACVLACIVPTLRALRVQPTEALRAEV